MYTNKRDNLFSRVTSWNLSRNGLHYNHDLEVKMLMEELGEILTAKTRTERLRECADFYFVVMGTMGKINHNHLGETTTANELANWILASTLWIEEKILDEDGTRNLLASAIEIICDANDLKPKDPVTGKVCKGPNYVDPIGKIEELIYALHN